MATLDVRSFSTIVGNIAAAVQGRAAQLLDYSIGSVLRAIAEADAGVVLWLQGQILRVLLLTRAATSSGPDLDTWVADYGLSRLGLSSATGYVQFTRFSTGAVGFVPVGATVRTSDLTQTYAVSVDDTNPAYSPTLNGYSLAIGIATVTVPVVAIVPGPAANAAAGTVTVINSNIPGIDLVNNSVGFVGGSDAESDTQLRARFVLYIASLSKGTVGALGYAITSLQLGLQYTITENEDLNGAADLGMVTIVVDDGTGNPSSAIVQNAQAAVNAYRAAGVRAGVYPAVGLAANISITVRCISGYNIANVAGSVSVAVSTFVNGLGLGVTLDYEKLFSVAYGVTGVFKVSSILLNSGTSDIVPTFQQTVKCSNVAVSAS